MDIKTEYYLNKYEELSVLSDTYKCKTTLVKNVDTGELSVKKIMDINAYKIYNKLVDVSNRNIPKVYDCFIINGKCVIIEEYINGKRLDSMSCDVYQAVCYEIQLCNAVSAIHKLGIIHRDINPKNIIVTNDGVIKLIDFDIARHEKIGASKDTEYLGTVGYASPEQYGFAQTNERSDIYSMGVLLRAMITGKEDGDLNIAKNKLPVKQYKVNITKIEKVITKCTEMDSRNRYSNVEELLFELKESVKIYEEQIEEKEQSENLPLITWKYVLKTIPGFKSGNIVFEIFAICIYALFVWAFGMAGWSLPVMLIGKIYAVVMYEVFLIVPYMYLTNIVHIAQRFPKMKFKTRFIRILYQIFAAFVWMLLIVIVMGITLPLETNK